MAYTTIDDPTIYFNTVLYTGNATARSITGVGFQPDWVWGKNRSTTNWHDLEDSVRGATKRLSSNETDAEATETVNFTSFDSDGFSVGTGQNVNGNGNSIVVWNWKAGGSASSNSNGSITSTVSANTTAGFSIVSYTGTGSNATVGHGLGSVPAWIITKNRDASQPWRIYHKGVDASAPEDFGLILNDTSVRDNDNTAWNDTAPTSSVFSVGTSANTNNSSDDFIAYCFAEKKGYSKFGSYTGNGTNNNGTFFYCGFFPSVVIIKASSSSRNWVILDNKRLGYNDKNYRLFPNLSNAEDTTSGIIDFTANGFKLMSNNNTVNESGVTYIVMAFAESPLVNSNGVPNNAR
jgi:hypothetical protein